MIEMLTEGSRIPAGWNPGGDPGLGPGEARGDGECKARERERIVAEPFLVPSYDPGHQV